MSRFDVGVIINSDIDSHIGCQSCGKAFVFFNEISLRQNVELASLPRGDTFLIVFLKSPVQPYLEEFELDKFGLKLGLETPCVVFG